MVTNLSSSKSSEPTPEFNEECLALINAWERGALPASAAAQSLKELAQQAASAGHTANEARAEHLQAYLQAHRGNYNISIDHYKKARRLFARVDNRAYIAKMDLNQGENYRYKGEFKRARSLYRSAYEAAADLGDILVQTYAIANEGLTLISLNDYESAQRALNEAIALTSQWSDDHARHMPDVLTEVHHGLATIELAHDNVQAAWDYALQALDNAQRAQKMLNIGFAYRILGDVMTHLDEIPTGRDDLPATPDDAYRASIQAFEDIGAEGEIGRTIFNHAQSFAERGRRSHAAKLFRKAMVVFTRRGMTSDVANAAEAQLRVI